MLSYRGLYSTSRELTQAHTLFFWLLYCWCLHNLFAWYIIRMLWTALRVPTLPAPWGHRGEIPGLNTKTNSTFPEQFVSIWSYKSCDSYKSISRIVEITSLEGMPELGIFNFYTFCYAFTLPASISEPLRISLDKERCL